jgi:hypothetical protein
LHRAVLQAGAAAGHFEQHDCLDDHPNMALADIGKHGRALRLDKCASSNP